MTREFYKHMETSVKFKLNNFKSKSISILDYKI